MPDQTRRVLAAGSIAYPESPRWHGDTLWFSDVHNFRLMRCALDGEPEIFADIPGRPAGLGATPDGRLLLATALGRALYWVDDQLTRAIDLSGLTRGLLNDMVVDARGRAYVGDTGYDLGAGEAPAPGRILFYDGVDRARCAAEDVTFPNGMAIAPDGSTLFVAETFAQRITAFDIAGDGSLSGRRVHAEVPGTPDGLCLDAEGALWVACLFAGLFVRIDRAGRVVERIDVSPYRAVACMLGGPDRRTLFLCQAAIDETDPQKPRRSGKIEWLETPVAGAGLP